MTTRRNHDPEPPPGPRGGKTYDPKRDFRRLNLQAGRVWRAMLDGKWRTLREIAEATGDEPQSVSARLRDYRKLRFGSHEVLRLRMPGTRGLHLYRLVPRRDNNKPAKA